LKGIVELDRRNTPTLRFHTSGDNVGVLPAPILTVAHRDETVIFDGLAVYARKHQAGLFPGRSASAEQVEYRVDYLPGCRESRAGGATSYVNPGKHGVLFTDFLNNLRNVKRPGEEFFWYLIIIGIACESALEPRNWIE